MENIDFRNHQARWGRAFNRTLIPTGPNLWNRLGPRRRPRFITASWMIVVATLVAGWFDERAFYALVAAAAVHLLVFFALVDFRAAVFPVQLRFTYLSWVAIGTFVPGCHFMLVIATIGGAALFTFDYCLLARLLYLLPWNREHPLTPSLALQTLIAKPGPGRFQLPPSQVVAELKPAAAA